MTIQDAILSRKRFRRKAWGTNSYWSINPFDGGLPWTSARWSVDDILATDWEIEGETK